jgi:hypothetical protein
MSPRATRYASPRKQPRVLLTHASTALLTSGVVFLAVGWLRGSLHASGVQLPAVLDFLLLHAPWIAALSVVATFWGLGFVRALRAGDQELQRLTPVVLVLAVGTIPLMAGPQSHLAWVAVGTGLVARLFCGGWGQRGRLAHLHR